MTPGAVARGYDDGSTACVIDAHFFTPEWIKSRKRENETRLVEKWYCNHGRFNHKCSLRSKCHKKPPKDTGGHMTFPSKFSRPIRRPHPQKTTPFYYTATLL
uniref:Uncharacterized protein n=1 Tax=Romanomermis culicivorax TaxID=13658 RepID=A0A915JX06_ROMCU